ncbi:MAG: metallophosphoesterase, partial [Acidobacteriota bacterium]|nr:metallophosphoesterase [Acidobacteriota bacterium]
MERSVLPSPRAVEAPVEPGAGKRQAVVDPRLHRGALPEPSPAQMRLRHFFKPATGWFRRLERKTSHVLSRDLYPWIPGLTYPYSRQLERDLTLSEGEIEVRALPSAFNGIRVLLVSDIHVGPFVRPDAIERVFRRLLTTEPDLIVVAGDVVTSHVREFPPFAGSFRLLEAPLGTVAVLGNHDHYTREPDRVAAMLEETGIRVLHNTAVAIDRPGARLVLAGIDDMLVGSPDLDAALEAARRLHPENDAPPLLISHNPDVFFEAAARGVSLVLSGHTHGGQFRFPGMGVLIRQSRCYLDEGRYTNGGSELVVTRGLGATAAPLRWNCPPEGVLLTLRGVS